MSISAKRRKKDAEPVPAHVRATQLSALKLAAERGDAHAVVQIKDHIRQNKILSKIDADPLGLTRGIKRPNEHPAQPTRQRILQAKARGELLDRRPLKTERGEVLNESITELVPQLRMLHRRRTISTPQFTGALQLCRDWHGSQFRGAATVNYDFRVDGGRGQLYESEYILDCRDRVYRALDHVPERMIEAVAWIIESMADGPPLSNLGARYLRPEEWDSLPNEAQLCTRGGVILRFTTDILCDAYRIRLDSRELTPHARAILAMRESRAGA